MWTISTFLTTIIGGGIEQLLIEMNQKITALEKENKLLVERVEKLDASMACEKEDDSIATNSSTSSSKKSRPKSGNVSDTLKTRLLALSEEEQPSMHGKKKSIEEMKGMLLVGAQCLLLSNTYSLLRAGAKAFSRNMDANLCAKELYSEILQLKWVKDGQQAHPDLLEALVDLIYFVRRSVEGADKYKERKEDMTEVYLQFCDIIYRFDRFASASLRRTLRSVTPSVRPTVWPCIAVTIYWWKR